jgi:hypothetical protein
MYITQTGNKTVIITTHYIEEARQAGTVSSRHALNINNTTRHANVNKADLFSALYSLASTICEWTIGAEWKAANLEL